MNDNNITIQVSRAIIKILKDNDVTDMQEIVTYVINGCATCIVNALTILGCDEPETEVADFFRQAADQLEGGEECKEN